MATIIPDCKNGYTKENIKTKFYESEKSREVCDTCPYLTYKNGTMMCKKQQEEN